LYSAYDVWIYVVFEVRDVEIAEAVTKAVTVTEAATEAVTVTKAVTEAVADANLPF